MNGSVSNFSKGTQRAWVYDSIDRGRCEECEPWNKTAVQTAVKGSPYRRVQLPHGTAAKSVTAKNQLVNAGSNPARRNDDSGRYNLTCSKL